MTFQYMDGFLEIRIELTLLGAFRSRSNGSASKSFVTVHVMETKSVFKEEVHSISSHS